LKFNNARVFSASEHLIQEHVRNWHQRKYRTGAAELKDHTHPVLHSSDFDPADIGDVMHQRSRLMDCISEGYIELIWDPSFIYLGTPLLYTYGTPLL
jgi:hypothetical protein